MKIKRRKKEPEYAIMCALKGGPTPHKLSLRVRCDGRKDTPKDVDVCVCDGRTVGRGPPGVITFALHD